MPPFRSTLSRSLHAAVLSVVAALSASTALSGEPADKGGDAALAETINQLDASFFDAFNRCDTAAMARVIAVDFEFYHDKGGLTRGRGPMLAMEEERCARTDTTLRREVLEESLAVYPMAGYGAVQQGMHRFYLSEGGGPEQLIEIARFMHVWREAEGGWEITRAISYDHRAP